MLGRLDLSFKELPVKPSEIKIVKYFGEIFDTFCSFSWEFVHVKSD